MSGVAVGPTWRRQAHGGRPGSVLVVIVAVLAVWTFALAPSGAVRVGATAAGATGSTRPPSPYIQHVVVVVLENQGIREVWSHGPYERYLAAAYGNATRTYAACHPSAPDYLAMFAAVTNQCGSDAWHNYTDATLGVDLRSHHFSWGAYAESLPATACQNPGGATSGLFATRHVPMLFFASDLSNRAFCQRHLLDSDRFNGSVANGTLRNFSFYTPNLCDDGHTGCGGNLTGGQLTAQADSWLKNWLVPMLNHTGRYSGAAEQAEIQHTAFVITWDEAVGSNLGFALPGVTGGENYRWCGLNALLGDAVCGGHVYTAIVSPYSVHTKFTTKDSTYGVCRTVEWLFHLSRLGNPGQMDNRSGFPAMKALFNFTANG